MLGAAFTLTDVDVPILWFSASRGRTIAWSDFLVIRVLSSVGVYLHKHIAVDEDLLEIMTSQLGRPRLLRRFRKPIRLRRDKPRGALWHLVRRIVPESSIQCCKITVRLGRSVGDRTWFWRGLNSLLPPSWQWVQRNLISHATQVSTRYTGRSDFREPLHREPGFFLLHVVPMLSALALADGLDVVLYSEPVATGEGQSFEIGLSSDRISGALFLQA